MSIGAREAYARSPTSASGAIGAIASCGTVLTATFPPCARHQLLAQFPAPRRFDGRSPQVRLEGRTSDSVLSGAGFRTFSQEPALEPRRCRTDTGKREQRMTASVAFVTKSAMSRTSNAASCSAEASSSSRRGCHWIIVDRAIFRCSGRWRTANDARDDRGGMPGGCADSIFEVSACARTFGSGSRSADTRWLVQQLVKLAVARNSSRSARPRRLGRRLDPSV